MSSVTTQPAAAPGLIGWLYVHVRALALLAFAGVLITGGLIYTGVLGIDQLDEEIRQRIETKFAAAYPHLRVKIESAQLLHGRGIQMRGVRITDPASDEKYAELLYIDEALAGCDTSLQELLTHEPHITGLTLNRLRLSATRKRGGEWNVAALLPLPKFGNSQCPTQIVDATIVICDPAINAATPLVLKNLNVSLARDESPEATAFLPESHGEAPLKITGQLTCDHFRKLSLEGWLDPVGGAWAIRGELNQLVLTPGLEQSLPVALGSRLSLQDLQGKLSLTYEMTNQQLATQTPADFPFLFEIVGKLDEGKLDDARLPHALTELTAGIRANNQGLQLQEVTARCGGARLGLSLTRSGWQTAAPLTVKGRVVQLALDTELADVLKPDERVLWDRFLPTGAANVDFIATFDGRNWQREVQAEMINLSVAYEKFPYRVTGGGGTLRLTDTEMNIDLFATAGRQRVTCKGTIHNPGPDYTGAVEIITEGPIPIDERFLLALDEPIQSTIRALSPRGEGTFHIRLQRDDPTQKLLPQAVVKIQNGSIKYQRFPYPLDHVAGTIRWENGVWTFEQFSASNDGAVVTANGRLARDQQGELQLHFDFACADLPLEDDLQRSLPENMQKLWANWSPSGVLDKVTAAVDYNCTRKQLSLDVQGGKQVRQQMVDTRSVSLEPKWLPYRLDHVTGSFRYKDGDITISGFKAQHDRMRVAGEAFCQLNPDGGWSVTFDRAFADRIEVDHALLEALPDSVSDLLAKVKLSGPLHLAGGGTITCDGRSQTVTSAQWDVTLDLENGSLDVGTPLEHIHGGVRLIGSANREGFASQGELSIDSVVVNGVQFTQVLGPLSLDSTRLLLGAWAQQPQVRGKVPRQITAKVCEGSLTADAALMFDKDNAFEIQAFVTDANLARLSAEALPKQSKLTGKLQGSLKLAGNRQGKHTYSGGGVLRLREADIYELPVMVALLKLLSVREPSKTAFNTADLDYRIQGEHIYLDKVDFVGDALTLKGSGETDWQRHLNLQFYTMVGRDEVHVPILRPLIGEASRNLMLITVSGSLDQPHLKREAFPGLNETLQQIFPEAKKK